MRPDQHVALVELALAGVPQRIARVVALAEACAPSGWNDDFLNKPIDLAWWELSDGACVQLLAEDWYWQVSSDNNWSTFTNLTSAAMELKNALL